MKNCFPVNIVATPLAYGKAELVKTTVSFKYDYFTIDRGARVADSDRQLREKVQNLISPFASAL